MTQGTSKPLANKLAGTPFGFMGVALLGTLVLSVCYKAFLKPKLDKQKRLKNASQADFIYQKEVELGRNNNRNN